MTRRRGTVERGSRGFYAVASVTDEAGVRHRPRQGPFGTARDAQAALGVMLADVERGSFVMPDRTPLGDYLTAWLDVHRVTLKPSTAHGYAGAVRRYVAPVIGRVALKDLRPAHPNALYAGMVGRGLSGRTVRTVTLARNVADAASLPRTASAEMRVWSADELRRFLTVAATDPLYPALYVAAFTGMRRGEVAVASPSRAPCRSCPGTASMAGRGAGGGAGLSAPTAPAPRTGRERRASRYRERGGRDARVCQRDC